MFFFAFCGIHLTNKSKYNDCSIPQKVKEHLFAQALYFTPVIPKWTALNRK